MHRKVPPTVSINLNKIIGDEAHFSLEHRILNIILLFGLLLSIWSAITNYLLDLHFLLVLTCIVSGAVMACLYYLSAVKKLYTVAISILIISGFTITPVAWILNGGISGSIPFYIILFSSIGAMVLAGRRRVAVTACFIVISTVLVIWEYNYPSLIFPYSSNAERYTDILIGLLTIIVANAVIFAVILNHYNKEHERAKIYLTQSQQAQDYLLYLSYHDALTGLYNRAYFEKMTAELDRSLPSGIGVFVVDVDGLKFINDTFGHEQGDAILVRAARALQSSFRSQDIIARIGGDEFAVIVREIAVSDMETLYQRIRDNMQKQNEKQADIAIPLHMSIGSAYSAGTDNKLMPDLLREADNKMYREKLYRQAGTKGSIIQAVKKMLSARDYYIGAHSERLQRLIAEFALAAGIPPAEIANIQLFAEFHDVGNIGIPDRILHKQEPLTQDEREQIQRHCEIGYRIAQATSDLLPISDWILKHHEWWNGKGYPLGIKGERIPLECRLLAIAIAYDAMTNGRLYRQAIPAEAAIEELERCAGTQFDPELVKIFIAVIRHMEA